MRPHVEGMLGMQGMQLHLTCKRSTPLRVHIVDRPNVDLSGHLAADGLPHLISILQGSLTEFPANVRHVPIHSRYSLS